MDAEAAAEAKAANQKDELGKATKAIQQRVNNSWIRPAEAVGHLTCEIQVTLTPDGTVTNFKITNPSGNDSFDNNAEIAVRKASPLPVPKDKELFNEKFRTFRFIFDPR
jgi:colicin import membrane protein